MDRSGIAYTQEEVSWLVGEIEKLKPFPDVVAALKELRSRGYKLTILSNGDRDMLKAAGPYIGFPFDHVISVQEAGYFKPHWKSYAKAERLPPFFLLMRAFILQQEIHRGGEATNMPPSSLTRLSKPQMAGSTSALRMTIYGAAFVRQPVCQN